MWACAAVPRPSSTFSLSKNVGSRGPRCGPGLRAGATAMLLAVILAAHGWIERALYGRALDRATRRLAAPAQQVQRQQRDTNAVETRAAVLANLQTGNWQKLRLLEQLTKLLPDGTWLQELHISEDTVEIYGFSGRAADLVPPLENSPYFTQVEFTAPITRDNKNKEIFQNSHAAETVDDR